MMDVFLSMIAVLYISISLFPIVVNRVDANYVTIPRTFNGCSLAFLSIGFPQQKCFSLNIDLYVFRKS